MPELGTGQRHEGGHDEGGENDDAAASHVPEDVSCRLLRCHAPHLTRDREQGWRWGGPNIQGVPGMKSSGCRWGVQLGEDSVFVSSPHRQRGLSRAPEARVRRRCEIRMLTMASAEVAATIAGTASQPAVGEPVREVRVLAIDRQVSVAEAFGRRLHDEDDLVFLGVLTNPHATIDTVRRLRPDVCLIDLLAGDGHDGLRALRDVATASTAVGRLVVVDLQAAGTALIGEALACEPDGFFATSEGLEELVKAVRQVGGGQDRFSPEVEIVAGTAQAVRGLFSRGELRVVCALAKHGNKAEAAGATYYSSETINTYVRRIRKHVAEHEGRPAIRLPDLIAWAREHGFHRIDLPD